MNVYLYPLLDNDGIVIRSCVAANRGQCEDKIKSIYVQNYDVDDTLDFDTFCDKLYDRYDILIGEIYEIDEFI